MRPNRHIDWIMLFELGLAALLVGLGVSIYWGPAADGVLAPRWWHGILLGLLFFLLVGIDSWRRRHRGHTSLHRVLRDAHREV